MNTESSQCKSEINTLKEPSSIIITNHPRPIDYLIDPITGCWNVISHTSNVQNYPQLSRGSKRTRIHRYSYELAYGKIPDGLCICHHCDNKRCINPNHLFLGTLQENTWDATQKGLMSNGEDHSMHKLSEIKVKSIRQELKAGKNQCEIAHKYGVTQSTISNIKTGRNWRHL